MIPVQEAQQILNVISSIFKKRPNKNDWKGWLALDRKNNLPDGTNAVSWVINDGDSIPNEALNILSFMYADIEGKKGLEMMLGYNSHFNREITSKDIAAKLRRANMHHEAQQFENTGMRNLVTQPTSSFFSTAPTSIFSPTPIVPTQQQSGTNKMSFNKWITIALMFLAVPFLLKQYFPKIKRFK